MGSQIVFVCVSAFQAGWLQTHAALESLESRGAVSLGDGTNRWRFPNGIVAQFASVTADVAEVLRSVEPYAQVVLLYEGDETATDEAWYIESILVNLAREKSVQVIHFRDLPRELQSWGTPTYEVFDTIPNLPRIG